MPNTLFTFMNSQNFNWKALIVWVGIGTLIGWQLNSAFEPSPANYEVKTIENTDLGLFWEVWDLMNKGYVSTDALNSQD